MDEMMTMLNRKQKPLHHEGVEHGEYFGLSLQGKLEEREEGDRRGTAALFDTFKSRYRLGNPCQFVKEFDARASRVMGKLSCTVTREVH